MKIIKLSAGKETIVDDDDFDFLSQFTWTFCPSRTVKTGYAYTFRALPSRKLTWFLMHRLIMMAEKGQIVDHKNGNSLDNRRCNLRFVTRSQSAMNQKLHANNTSGYTGVWLVHRKYPCASIQVNKKVIYLGMFKTVELAAAAYDNAARKYFGEFYREICRK